jgi:hypothetical protein
MHDYGTAREGHDLRLIIIVENHVDLNEAL